MKRNFKRVMSLLLTVLMVLTAVPFATFAAEECEHDYNYAYDSDDYHTYRCSKCGDRGFEKCSGGEATCKDKAVCEKCKTAYGELSTVHGEATLVLEDKYLASKATCIAKAYYYYQCEVCEEPIKNGETISVGKIDPDGHEYDEAVANTGELAGTHSAVCSLCKENVLSAECFDEEPEVFAPDCTTAGKTENKCDACGYEWVSDEKAALGHDFSEVIVDEAHLKSAATCTAKATYWYDCAVCDVNAKNDTEATDAYYENGETEPHSFTATVADEKYIVSAANCQQKAVYYKSCTACGLSSKGTADADTFEGAMGTHSWGTYVYNNDAKCGVDGTETATCTINGCNEKDTRTKAGTALQHVFTEEIVDEAHIKDAATCTAKATYWKDCAREGCAVMASDATVAANYFEAGEFAAHSFTEEIKDEAHLKEAATCVAKPVYWYDCANCDVIASDATVEANYYTDEAGELKTHEFTVEKVEDKYLAVAATCSTKAIYYKSCACGESGKNAEVEAVFETGEVLGHIVETIPGKDPTCTADGYTESRVCKREINGKKCGAVLKEQVKRPATGHKEYVSVPKSEATCTKVGYSEEKKCAVCEQLLTLPSMPSPALGHTDSDNDEICDRAGCGTILTGDGVDCSCLCHQTGIMRIIYFIVNLIWKLIGANKYCDCGIEHY